MIKDNQTRTAAIDFPLDFFKLAGADKELGGGHIATAGNKGNRITTGGNRQLFKFSGVFRLALAV